MVPSVVADDGIVYCLGGRSGVAALAVRAGGSGDVTKTHRLWTSIKGSNVSSPVYHDGHLYWMNDSRGIAYCAKADSGEVVYEERLPRAEQVYSSALLADGRLYYLTRDGRTFVLAAKPEFEQLAVNDLRDGSVFNGSPPSMARGSSSAPTSFCTASENSGDRLFPTGGAIDVGKSPIAVATTR